MAAAVLAQVPRVYTWNGYDLDVERHAPWRTHILGQRQDYTPEMDEGPDLIIEPSAFPGSAPPLRPIFSTGKLLDDGAEEGAVILPEMEFTPLFTAPREALDVLDAAAKGPIKRKQTKSGKWRIHAASLSDIDSLCGVSDFLYSGIDSPSMLMTNPSSTKASGYLPLIRNSRPQTRPHDSMDSQASSDVEMGADTDSEDGEYYPIAKAQDKTREARQELARLRATQKNRRGKMIKKRKISQAKGKKLIGPGITLTRGIRTRNTRLVSMREKNSDGQEDDQEEESSDDDEYRN